jgi:acyl-CoA synthetase (AMP-forming)/AMP-acid ligase II
MTTLRWPDDSLPEPLRLALVGPGGPFELAVEDVLGAPIEVFTRRPRSVGDVLRKGAATFGDRPYVIFPDRTLTFESVIGAVASLARGLADTYGISKGDRVAIASANRVEYVLTFWAATVLGAVTVALNGWWTGPEMSYALELTIPRLVVGDQPRLARLAETDFAGAPVLAFGEEFAALEAFDPGAELPTTPVDEDDPYVILFTSGTTGRPKGAAISHRNNIHFGLAMQLRGAEAVAKQRAAGLEGAPPGHPVTLGASPMFHVSGLTCTLVVAPMTGQTLVYPPPGRWQETDHLELTERHRVTHWTVVPTQLWRLLEHPDLSRYDLSSLQMVGGGGAVWPPELLRRLAEKIPGARPGLALGYGLTETIGLGTSLRGELSYDHPDSIGQASPTVEVQIRDPLTREELPEGQVGEIALRTAACIVGYWDDDQATARAFDGDRWYHTGDFGHVSEGLVYLEGRRQDLIIRGGENIYPVEIENRLIEHAGIAEAAVVGVDHPTLGQEPRAYVVERVPGSLSAAQVQEWCGQTLARFKVPTSVVFVAEFPHNASGKVLKHLLGSDAKESGFIAE